VTRFLPTLRRASSKALAAAEYEAKVVLSSYYSALHAYESGSRARHWPVERAVLEGYERVIWVFKAVNTIGADHARLPFRLKQDDKDVEDHPLCRVLNKRANPLETGQVFRKRLSAQILLSKQGAFVEKTYSNGGTIKRVDLLPPDRVRPVPGAPGSDVLIDHWELTRRDGGIRDIPPKNVLWFRDPHPLDPYSGVTPLEAAGLSVELDYFARLYNVTFMRNDGRPGGVLGIKAPDGRSTTGKVNDVSKETMDRIESRFHRGPAEAGKLSVLTGELSYVDLATRPRDMQYAQTSRNSKIELLSSFGVPESVLGYSAERTYDNADAELYTYWTRTLFAHNEIIVAGFDEDSEDDLEGYLDVSGVEVLARVERAAREEARSEVEAGLRSIKSYADKAGYGDEIDDTPHTRALYVPQGRTPLPSREEDAKALGLDIPSDAPPPPPAPELPPAGDPAAGAPAALDMQPGAPALDAAPTPDQGQVPADGGLPSGWAPPGGGAPAIGGASASPPAAIGGAPAMKALPRGARAVMQVKRAAYEPVPINDRLDADATYQSVMDERARDRLEDTITTALTVLATRWLARAEERLKSPKSRKGTRHWQADSPSDTRGGTKALDSAKAIDEERWISEAEAGTQPIVAAAATAAAAAMLADLDADEDGTLAASVIVADLVAAVVRMIATSAGKQALRLIRIINEADQDGQPFGDIVDTVREQAGKFTSWANGVATQAATAAINGAREATAEEIEAASNDVIIRTWLSRRDEKVRHSHHEADGQKQPVGQPFLVGDSLLRFPGDPLAPVHETANCRCRLLHKSKRSGRFVSAPLAS
jgi:HK97 family phage portal protein